MGALSRRKGHDFERWVATQFRQALPKATVRRSDQGYGAFEPDVVIEGDAPAVVKALWFECYHGRCPNPLAKLAQAERDVVGKGYGVPVVIWRCHGERSVQATMRAVSFWWVQQVGLIHAEGTEIKGQVPVTIDFEDFLSLLKSEH